MQCDLCGHEMADENGNNLIGVALDLRFDQHRHPEARRVIEKFGRSSFSLCWCCWIERLGFLDIKTEGDKSIEISKERYEELLEEEKLLNALRNAGVDNWDGWDFAIDSLERIEKK